MPFFFPKKQFDIGIKLSLEAESIDQLLEKVWAVPLLLDRMGTRILIHVLCRKAIHDRKFYTKWYSRLLYRMGQKPWDHSWDSLNLLCVLQEDLALCQDSHEYEACKLIHQSRWPHLIEMFADILAHYPAPEAGDVTTLDSFSKSLGLSSASEKAF